MSPHTVGIFWLCAAIVATIFFVVSLLPVAAPPGPNWLCAALFAVLALYLWPQAINALG